MANIENIAPDEIYKEEISKLMFENASQIVMKTGVFYRLRELDEILEKEVREVEKYVKDTGDMDEAGGTERTYCSKVGLYT
jgi:hypothetical protein